MLLQKLMKECGNWHSLGCRIDGRCLSVEARKGAGGGIFLKIRLGVNRLVGQGAVTPKTVRVPNDL